MLVKQEDTTSRKHVQKQFFWVSSVALGRCYFCQPKDKISVNTDVFKEAKYLFVEVTRTHR